MSLIDQLEKEKISKFKLMRDEYYPPKVRELFDGIIADFYKEDLAALKGALSDDQKKRVEYLMYYIDSFVYPLMCYAVAKIIKDKDVLSEIESCFSRLTTISFRQIYSVFRHCEYADDVLMLVGDSAKDLITALSEEDESVFLNILSKCAEKNLILTAARFWVVWDYYKESSYVGAYIMDEKKLKYYGLNCEAIDNPCYEVGVAKQWRDSVKVVYDDSEGWGKSFGEEIFQYRYLIRYQNASSNDEMDKFIQGLVPSIRSVDPTEIYLYTQMVSHCSLFKFVLQYVREDDFYEYIFNKISVAVRDLIEGRTLMTGVGSSISYCDFCIDSTQPNLYGSGDEGRKYIRGLKTVYKNAEWMKCFINLLADSKQIASDVDTKLLLATRILGRDYTGGNLFDENGEPRKIEWLGKVNNLFYMIKNMFDNNNKVTPTQLFFSCEKDTKGLLAGKNHSQCAKDAEIEFKAMLDEK